MAKHFLISFGIWITIIPFLGIPGVWKNSLIIISGLFLIFISLWPIILEKLEEKPKIKKKKNVASKNLETKIEFDKTNLTNDGSNTGKDIQL